jgi:hypothetical protein
MQSKTPTLEELLLNLFNGQARIRAQLKDNQAQLKDTAKRLDTFENLSRRPRRSSRRSRRRSASTQQRWLTWRAQPCASCTLPRMNVAVLDLLAMSLDDGTAITVMHEYLKGCHGPAKTSTEDKTELPFKGDLPWYSGDLDVVLRADLAYAEEDEDNRGKRAKTTREVMLLSEAKNAVTTDIVADIKLQLLSAHGRAEAVPAIL